MGEVRRKEKGMREEEKVGETEGRRVGGMAVVKWVRPEYTGYSNCSKTLYQSQLSVSGLAVDKW